MVRPNKLIELINHTVEELPYDKQQEVYDFASYLRSKAKGIKAQSNSNFSNMIDILEGPSDLATNHDEIYD